MSRSALSVVTDIPPAVVIKDTSATLPAAATSVAVSVPSVMTTIEPSAVSTSVKVKVPKPSKLIAPDCSEEASTSLPEANSNLPSTPKPPISSRAVSVIKSPEVTSKTSSSMASLIEPAGVVNVSVVPAVIEPTKMLPRSAFTTILPIIVVTVPLFTSP